MYSKILFKLIQEAAIPAFGLLVIKILITTYYARMLGYNTDLYNIFSLQVSQTDYTIINSNVIFGFVIFSFFGLAYCLAKSLFFHNSHISPKVSLSIFNLRVGFLIQDSFHLFSQTLIWLLFNFSILFITLLLYFLGLIYGSVLLMSLILCLIGMYFFILDIEFEYRKGLEEGEEEVFVL